MPDPHLPYTFDLARIGAGLPAAALIDELNLAEAAPSPRLVVEAPPGTGKTTVVPPMIAEYLAGAVGSAGTTGSAGAAGGTGSAESPSRIIVTQPRRMAARAAAGRLASLTGTRLGEVVGFTVRGESRTSAATRIEFVTTGVLLSRLLRDPELSGVAGVILDEVHERQLDTDLAFAMCRELADLREDLSVVVMSATLDAQLWAARLGDGPQAPANLLSVAADAHPLEVRWAPAKERPLDARGVTWNFLDHLAAVTVRAMEENATGDVLVFAPGAREVDEVAFRVRRRIGSSADVKAGTSGDASAAGGSNAATVEVHTLTGRTPAKEQDAILRPRTDSGRNRRVIVSTSVAESALTIDGVRIVVDSGLSRGPRLDYKAAHVRAGDDAGVEGLRHTALRSCRTSGARCRVSVHVRGGLGEPARAHSARGHDHRSHLRGPRAGSLGRRREPAARSSADRSEAAGSRQSCGVECCGSGSGIRRRRSRAPNLSPPRHRNGADDCEDSGLGVVGAWPPRRG
nr:DEAD/DEAH box helicase [Brevibacterium pigmentatum]